MDDTDYRWAEFSIHVTPETNSPEIYRVTFRQLGRQDLRRMPGQPHAEVKPPDVTMRVRWAGDKGTIEEYKEEASIKGITQQDFQTESLKRVKAKIAEG
ncbi:MAG TPA: hypothetical protein VMG10_25855 [Gemmataceae bacterium]|nr:hypothetical protein [Gemmataceae bacterium]